jgi:hypothetical protein
VAKAGCNQEDFSRFSLRNLPRAGPHCLRADETPIHIIR